MVAILNLTEDNCLECKTGTDYQLPIQWQNSDKTVIPVSETYKVKMQVRDNTNGNLLIEASTDNGRITFDSNETIIILLTSSDTELFEEGMYVYDIKLIPLTIGYIEVLAEGNFQVRSTVTTL